jgi:hypothetical protein
MGPQAQQGLELAGIIIVAFQAVTAVVVMRALTNNRPDLSGAGRLVPLVLTFCIPVLGPMVAGRVAGIGLRPLLVSMAGLAVGLGVFAMKPPKEPLPKSLQQIAVTRIGQPAAAPANAKADAAKADAAKADAAKAGGEKKPAETGAPAPVAAPAHRPLPPRPTAATAAPAAAPQPAPKATPAPTPAATPAPQPASPAAPKVTLPLPAGTDVLAESHMVVTMGQGATLEQHLQDGRSVYFGAVVSAPPGSPSGAPRRLYLGGGIRNYAMGLADRFGPRAVEGNELEPGTVLTLPSRRGGHHVTVRVNQVTKDADGVVHFADLDVQVR